MGDAYQSIFTMELHDALDIVDSKGNSWQVLRVSDGWIYSNKYGAAFVLYNEDSKSV